MESKHTPGPWTHYDFGSDKPIGPYIVAVTVDPKGDRGPIRGYTVTSGQLNTGASTYWPAQGIGGRSDEEAIANARLIAAAPDLLEALKMAIRWSPYKGDSEETDFTRAARAAIAKAEGRDTAS